MRYLWSKVLSVANRVLGSLRFSADEREMREEMQFHLDMAARKYRAAGLTEADAQRAARLTFGGVEQWREAARSETRSRLTEDVVRDVVYAVRSLRRVPAFAATVILSLGIGIGAVSTVWTVTERVVLRPLAYDGRGALIFIWTNYRQKPDTRDVDSYADYLDWTKNNPDIEHAAAFNIWAPTLTEGDEPEPLIGSRVTAGFFDVFGVRPMLGRTFRPDDDVPNGPPVAVIAHSLWTRRFHSDPNIVGKTFSMNRVKYTVIGVMPASFRDPEPLWKHGAEIWRPLDLTATSNPRHSRWLRVVARLKPNVPVERAQRDLAVISGRLSQAFPESNRERGTLVVPVKEQVVGESRPILYAALGGAVCLLLIVCGNIASLVLARNAVRAPELAVRAAMGAERPRLARMLSLETIVLSAAGCALGILFAVAACALLRHAAPPGLPRIEEVQVDMIAVALTAACGAIAALLFGVLPSWRVSRVDLISVLQGAGARTTARGRGRSAIVVGELAFCLVLLVAAGLLTKSMLRLNDIPLGLQADDLVTFDVSLPNARYPSDSADRAFFATLGDRLRRTPGIVGVAMTSSPPFTGYNDMTMSIGGPVDHPKQISPHFRSVTPGYFALLHVPLRGRDFTEQDNFRAGRVAIINRAAADVLFPDENPIGKRLLTSSNDSNPATVIGVAGNVRFYGPASAPEPELFLPQPQYIWNDYTVMVSGPGASGEVIARARGALRSIDPNIPLADPGRLSDDVTHFSARQRYYALVFGSFAAAAVLLSAVGVFGVIAYAVTQRRREIAIRLALGAQPAQIARRFIANATTLVVLGLILGTAAAVAIGRALASLLFGVSPSDVPTLVASAAVLALVGVVASAGPALRAVRTAPVRALSD